MLVMKFGGTSVQDAESMRRLFEIVTARQRMQKTHSPIIIVVSAMAKVTDTLVRVAQNLETQNLEAAKLDLANLITRHKEVISELLTFGDETQTQVLFSALCAPLDELMGVAPALAAIGEVSGRSRDRLLATGELCSSRIVAKYFEMKIPQVSWVDSREWIATDSKYGSASVDFQKTNKQVQNSIEKNGKTEIFVCGGFIGRDPKGHTTTLGRGGSDYSASVIGAAAKAKSIEIWTDVDGVLTTDPRLVAAAKRIEEMSFAEASELAYFGAKVLHPATIFPAVADGIPVYVLNSKNPQSQGTCITARTEAGPDVIKAIAFKRGVTMITIHSTRMLMASGFLKSIYDVFADHSLSVDLISTSEVSVSMTLDSSFNPRQLEEGLKEIAKFASIEVAKDKASISAVGLGIKQRPGVAARIFKALEAFNVSMISMGASEVNISLVVDDKDLAQAVQRLHQEFFNC